MWLWFLRRHPCGQPRQPTEVKGRQILDDVLCISLVGHLLQLHFHIHRSIISLFTPSPPCLRLMADGLSTRDSTTGHSFFPTPHRHRHRHRHPPASSHRLHHLVLSLFLSLPLSG
ncbi:hypothetical protein HanRHA438_Chr10g0468351 [Helianthus annuus]|nr:hypothetical protein HanRHA438_Chr10g0468351 [Helianthus annuus]KAJ0893610.1 hypothetical protein HanPSC8_Chr09g0379701 [Helianthus annuus]